jgi:hypothetical protein
MHMSALALTNVIHTELYWWEQLTVKDPTLVLYLGSLFPWCNHTTFNLHSEFIEFSDGYLLES